MRGPCHAVSNYYEDKLIELKALNLLRRTPKDDLNYHIKAVGDKVSARNSSITIKFECRMNIATANTERMDKQTG